MRYQIATNAPLFSCTVACSVFRCSEWLLRFCSFFRRLHVLPQVTVSRAAQRWTYVQRITALRFCFMSVRRCCPLSFQAGARVSTPALVMRNIGEYWGIQIYTCLKHCLFGKDDLALNQCLDWPHAMLQHGFFCLSQHHESATMRFLESSGMQRKQTYTSMYRTRRWRKFQG